MPELTDEMVTAAAQALCDDNETSVEYHGPDWTWRDFERPARLALTGAWPYIEAAPRCAAMGDPQDAAGALEVTVRDPETGVTETTLLQPGNYALICAAPCRLAEEHHAVTGTTTLILRDRDPGLMATKEVARG